MRIMGSDSAKPIDISDPFARQLMARYLERREADIGGLRAALEDSDFDAIRVTGHNLFGSGAAYGLEQISHFGEAIESAAEARDRDRIAVLIADLEHFIAGLTLR